MRGGEQMLRPSMTSRRDMRLPAFSQSMIAEFVPVGADKSGFGVSQSFIDVFVIGDLRQDGFGARNRFGIGGVNVGAFI